MKNTEIIQQSTFLALLVSLDPESRPFDAAGASTVKQHLQSLSRLISPQTPHFDLNSHIEHKILSNTRFFMISESESFIGLFDFMGTQEFIIELDADMSINVLGDSLSNWAEERYPSPYYRAGVDQLKDKCQQLYGINPDRWDSIRHPDFFNGYVTP